MELSDVRVLIRREAPEQPRSVSWRMGWGCQESMGSE